MRFLLLIGVVTWHVTSSTAMEIGGLTPDGVELVTRSSNSFAPIFLKTVADEHKGNLICSPLSASMVLSMAAYGARGNTEKQMRTVLALPEDDALAKSGFQSFIDTFKNYNKVDLRLANKMFLAKDMPPKQEFQEMATTGFRSDVQNLNFAESAVAAKTINDWCMAQTANRIKDLFKPDDFDSSTLMVLVNAVYFKGNWATKFNPAETKPRPFHVDGKEEVKDVPTMYRFGSYRYGELPDVKAKFIELPYKSESYNDSTSMFVVLPDEINGLPELMKNVENITMDKLQGFARDVHVYMPKFKIESELPLNGVLAKMGMSDMFTDAANFSGIIDSPPVKVSKVIQKAFIEVNEEGSEAAAATGIGFAVITSAVNWTPPPIYFKVDRPSLFILTTKNTFMFVATLSDP